MPRYLYLLRHAQSADKQNGQTDKERTLTATGLAEANVVGKFLKEISLIPDLMITSSAVRTKTTAQIVAGYLAFNSESIIAKDDLYDATVADLFQVAGNLTDDVNKLIIIGHNPTLSLFVDHVTNEHNRGLLPAELVILKFEAAEWKDIHEEKAELIERFHPTV